jgi:hypothetical protein
MTIKQQLIRILIRSAKILNLDGLIPDKTFQNLIYYRKYARWIDWENPKTFNEKLQWLKVYNRRPEYTDMVDKIKVKEYVAKKLGEEYIIPTLGVWDRAEDIDFNQLPDKFVLKCNHDSGSVCICKDKSTFDFEATKRKLNRCLKKDMFRPGREWPYKNVERKIFAEALLGDHETNDLRDYKVFNFNGEPKIIQVDFDRFSHHMRNVYDLDWNRLEMEIQYPSNPEKVIDKPQNLQAMLNAATVLSEGIPHARTDFYCVDGKLYFGEITFFHGSGYEVFRPEEWDEKLGKLIILPPPVSNIYIVKGHGFTLLIHSKMEYSSKYLTDYKFYCFNGVPKYCQVISGRDTDECIDFYDMNWDRMIGMIGMIGMGDKIHASDSSMPQPATFQKMKDAATVLCQNQPFVRVDFYEVNHLPYFGEITFYPTSGFGEFRPDEWNKTLGDMLILPPPLCN